MLAGKLASESVPPKLTASLKICSEFRKPERRRLAADNVERKRGSRAQALSREHAAGGGGFVVMGEVVNLLHLIVIT